MLQAIKNITSLFKLEQVESEQDSKRLPFLILRDIVETSKLNIDEAILGADWRVAEEQLEYFLEVSNEPLSNGIMLPGGCRVVRVNIKKYPENPYFVQVRHLDLIPPESPQSFDVKVRKV